MNFEKIVQELKTAPEVTKSEALRAVLEIGEQAEGGDEDAKGMIAEICGFAATCDSAEFMRRFIVWQLNYGPIA